MASGLPDRVDCALLADNAVALDRVYSLGEMPRLQDLLADTRGTVCARFAFARDEAERAGASVAVEALPQLICQRCLQGFAFAAAGSSEVEFTSDPSVGASDAQREAYAMVDGLISLRELAEEELLLALPIVAVCAAPQSCGRAPTWDTGETDETAAVSRPFKALQDLLKKT
jgi:uncharacterized protein